jgi:hypothetical protein
MFISMYFRKICLVFGRIAEYASYDREALNEEPLRGAEASFSKKTRNKTLEFGGVSPDSM